MLARYLYHSHLLVGLVLFVRGLEGLFVKQVTSGYCLLPLNAVAYGKGLSWGKMYLIKLQDNCFDTNAQFRFKDKELLYNIAKDGIFLTRNIKTYFGAWFYIYHPAEDGPYAFAYNTNHALTQTKEGSLFMINKRFCVNPVQTHGEVFRDVTCGRNEQKFVFGSATCEGNMLTDVNCPSKQVISTQMAKYGGHDNLNRCEFKTNMGCYTAATCFVQTQCNGKSSCNMTVEQRLFKIDPCHGKPKYLYLEYQCVEHTKPVTQLFVENVIFSESVRPNEGQLELIISKRRNKVCAKSLNDKAREVVCRHFGYQGVKSFTTFSAIKKKFGYFSGSIECSGQETTLSKCCLNNATQDNYCSSFSYVSCLICHEPLLEQKETFPDSIFSASKSLGKNTAANARVLSNSSWCTSKDTVNHLQIDLGRAYLINSVTTFGDSATASWVTLYKLSYTLDLTVWRDGVVDGKKEITANTNAYSNAATRILDIKARVLKFIPIESNGQRCMRVEICGHTLFPDKPTKLRISELTSTSLAVYWTRPENDGDKIFTEYLIILKESNSVIRKFTLSDITTKLTLKNLNPHRVYKLSISAGNMHGFGEEETIEFTTLEAAPSSPPRNVTVIAKNSSSISLSWEPPDDDKRNGIITNYTVCISRSKKGACFEEFITREQKYLFTNLNSSTKYSVRVRAATKVGSGNFSCCNKKYTNGKPLDKPLNATSNTLIFILQIPDEYFSFIEVIALKLTDGKTPDKSPDQFMSSDILHYSAAMKSSEPVPYIAAVIPWNIIETEKEFVLGDGRTYIFPINRRRRRSERADGYFNGPLDPDSSYTIFQRVYSDKGDYYSTDWSPPAQTSPAAEARDGGNTDVTAIVVSVVAVCVILAVIAAVIVYRRRMQKPKSTEQMQSELQSRPGVCLGANAKLDSAPVNDAITTTNLGFDSENVHCNNGDEMLYCNQEDISISLKDGIVLPSQFEIYVNEMKRDGNYGFQKEFKKLLTGPQYPCDVSKKPFNKQKNRFGNIATYDHSRVVLPGDEKSDYINASHIDGITKNYYIATQGPKTKTINDFWRMVFAQRSQTIVMVTTLMEMGKSKCEKYWPDDCATYGEVKVTAKQTKSFADHVIRTFLVEKNGEKLRVKHFHFTVWPDHGVPHYPTQILSFRKNYKSSHGRHSGPVIVHCSAGIGRTGVLIAIDRTIDEIEQSGSGSININDFVKEMRTRRMNMIQTLEQYVFVHDAVLDYIKCGANEVDAVNIVKEIQHLAKKNSEGETGFQEKFKRLHKVSPARLKDDECESALLDDNKKKNREDHIYPSKLSRVHLGNSDYINATFVDGFLGKKYFIATQTPLRETINDFWRMVYEHKCCTIIMLNQLKENNKEYPMFWPTETAKPCSYGSITLQLESAKKIGDIVSRKFIVSSSRGLKEGRVINMIQYIGWTNHGTAQSNSDVLNLLSEVERSQRSTGKGPVTVMCSDGAGRTGTFITISNLVDRVKIMQVLDVFQCIKLIRSQRPQFVENASQFRMCYEVVNALLTSFEEYSNFEVKAPKKIKIKVV